MSGFSRTRASTITNRSVLCKAFWLGLFQFASAKEEKT